ncbi:hypothetical protein BH10PSE7_BH10PSE7_15200 [soil metagenome]
MADLPLDRWARETIDHAFGVQGRGHEDLWEKYRSADPLCREALFMVAALDLATLKMIRKTSQRASGA